MTLIVPDWAGWTEKDERALPPDVLDALADLDGAADESGGWPSEIWSQLIRSGATTWARPGDGGCDRGPLTLRYARIAEASLTAAFILTQHDAAVRRLAAARGEGLATAEGWLDRIDNHAAFATVGISQLTTSRKHGARALVASPRAGGGFTLDGVMPWVTGAEKADVTVVGAVLEDGAQMLAAVPAGRGGLVVEPALRLAAVQASCTAEVRCEGVEVSDAEVLAGPAPDLSALPGLAGTGGLETSALALGQARASLVALAAEAGRHEDLVPTFETLASSWRSTAQAFEAAAFGVKDAPAPASLRAWSNALTLRAGQTILTARRGAGFTRPDLAQRLARQALFFLVWSCPSAVAQATLRDLTACGSS
jgi:alkylation response protein AidB-like acyl-CoA dehydrogenase